jgi:hypothetical protein
VNASTELVAILFKGMTAPTTLVMLFEDQYLVVIFALSEQCGSSQSADPGTDDNASKTCRRPNLQVVLWFSGL